jgi:hypothetical protein
MFVACVEVFEVIIELFIGIEDRDGFVLFTEDKG